MKSDSNQEVSLESLARDVRSTRYTFGISIIIIAIILIATLPEIIQNSIFRNEQTATIGTDQPTHRTVATTTDNTITSTSSETR